MTHAQLVEYFMRKLQQISAKHQGKRNQHLYEQGVLIGLLASLSYRDSQNFDLIKRQLDKIIDSE